MVSGSQPANESESKRKKAGPQYCRRNIPGSMRHLPHSLELRAWDAGCLFPTSGSWVFLKIHFHSHKHSLHLCLMVTPGATINTNFTREWEGSSEIM